MGRAGVPQNNIPLHRMVFPVGTPDCAPRIAPSSTVTWSAMPTCPAMTTLSAMTALPEIPVCAAMTTFFPTSTLCPMWPYRCAESQLGILMNKGAGMHAELLLRPVNDVCRRTRKCQLRLFAYDDRFVPACSGKLAGDHYRCRTSKCGGQVLLVVDKDQ